MWYSFAQTKVRRVSSATNQWTRNSITATAVGTVEVLFAGMRLSGDGCLADVIQSHSGAKVFIEQEVLALTRVVNGQTEHARMDLVFYLNGSVTHLDVSIVSPFSCNPSLVSAASTKPRTYGQKSGKEQI